MVTDGYEFFANRRLVTIFSAPGYMGDFDNDGAMMDVDETLPVTIGYCDPEKPDVPCILFEPPFHYIERNTGKVYTLSFEIVTRGMLGDFKIRYRCDDYDQGGVVCDQYVNINDVKKDKNGKSPYQYWNWK